MRAVIVSIVAALVMMAAAARTEAQEPRRVALVIGNGAYQSLGVLDNPRLDAEKVAALLAANGFDVVRCDGQRPGCFDLTRDGLEQALETLRTKAGGADLALVFYAGHGMEGRDGNVLAPIDTEVIDCTERALRRGVPLDELFKAVSGARRKIVILDACRDDPFAQCPPMRGARPASFAPLTAPESESFLLVLSTKPGQVALDGPAGAHSPYARALLQWLEKEPAVYFHDVLSHTAKEVIEATSRTSFTQVPEMLARGELPAACLKGQDCVGDVRAATMRQELEALKQEHARDQELAAVARDYLAAAEKERARRPLTEEEKKAELQRLKEVSKGVSDFLLEAAEGRGRPFSREEEAETLARLMDAGRALLALNDTRAEQALERLKAGDESEAERLFDEVLVARKRAAATAQARAADENKEAAKAARHLAAIAKPKNVAKAADAYKEAAELDPADAQTWIDYGRAARLAGRGAEARAAFAQADAKARESNDLLSRHQAAMGLGDVADAQIRRAEAEQHYRAALALAEPAARAHPGNPAWQRALSTAHDRVGYILAHQGNLPAAAESFRAALAIAEPLAKADPGNGELAQELASMHYTFGWVLARQRDSSGASASYQAAREIAERFSRVEPNNGNWLSTLVLFHSSIAAMQLQLQREPGDFAGALASLQTALAHGERMAKIDPSNIRWQRVLAAPHLFTGTLLEKQGDHAGAIASYRAVQDMAKRLAQLDPGSLDPPYTVALTQQGIGRVLFRQRDLAGALARYEEAASIYQRLLQSDATNESWQLTLASVESGIGDVLAARGDLTGALASYRAALASFGRTSSPDSAWPTHFDVAQILEKQGDRAGALASYRAVLSGVEIEARTDSGNARHQDTLALTHRIIGDKLQQQGDLAEALASHRAALAIDEKLAESDPGNSERLQQVATDHYKIGEILRARNDRAGALASFRAAIADFGKAGSITTLAHSQLALAQGNVGEILEMQGDLPGALASYRAMQSAAEHATRIAPADALYQGHLSLSHRLIGGLLLKQDQRVDAISSYRAALAVAEALAKSDPGNASYKNNIALTHGLIGGALRNQVNLADALASYRAALAIDEELLVAEAGSTERQQSVAANHYEIGFLLHLQGDLAGALASYRARLPINVKLAAADPDNSNRQWALWGSHVVIGEVLHDQGRLADALASLTAAQDIAERRFKAEPGSSVWAGNLARSCSATAGAQRAKGDRAGAVALWRKALAIAEASAVAVEQEETKTEGKSGKKTAEALRLVGWQALLARDVAKARAAWERAGTLVPDLAWLDVARAHVLLFRNRPREARPLYLKGKGKIVDANTWEELVVYNFQALRRAGLARPIMREIDVALGVAPAQAGRPATGAAARKTGK
jgi:tetratricopeptide (TPR) repeat protein